MDFTVSEGRTPKAFVDTPLHAAEIEIRVAVEAAHCLDAWRYRITGRGVHGVEHVVDHLTDETPGEEAGDTRDRILDVGVRPIDRKLFRAVEGVERELGDGPGLQHVEHIAVMWPLDVLRILSLAERPMYAHNVMRELDLLLLGQHGLSLRVSRLEGEAALREADLDRIRVDRAAHDLVSETGRRFNDDEIAPSRLRVAGEGDARALGVHHLAQHDRAVDVFVGESHALAIGARARRPEGLITVEDRTNHGVRPAHVQIAVVDPGEGGAGAILADGARAHRERCVGQSRGREKGVDRRNRLGGQGLTVLAVHVGAQDAACGNVEAVAREPAEV